MADRMKRRESTRGILAEFDSPASLLRACDEVRRAGFRNWDAHTPFPVHGLDRAMGLRPSKLPWIVLVMALSGTAGAMVFQGWVAAVDYPFVISGKPLFSWQAFIPVTFEVTILLGALASVGGMLALNRLPKHNTWLFDSRRFERVSDDAFFISIEGSDPRFRRQKDRAIAARRGSEARGERGGDMKRSSVPLVSVLALAASAAACRGQRSGDPPIHLNPNMDNQAYLEAQEPSPFFPDGRGMRPEVPGTVPMDGLHEDDHMYRGIVHGHPAQRLPVELDAKLLRRGRERFDIYCAPCHDGAGTGQGIVVKRGMLQPPSFHDDRIRAMPVGEVFGVVTHGVRNMPSYAAQIPAQDRWAIVAYVRALQLSRTATARDVPGDVAASKGWTK